MADSIELRFAAFADALGTLEIIGVIFFLLIVAETFWDFFSNNRKEYKETLANFAIAVGSALLDRTIYGLVFILALVIAQDFTPLTIPITWWSWVLALIAADLSYYWMHRWEHEIRIFWAHHVVHHSSPEYNLTTSMRLAWLESLVEWIFLLPMIFLGFDAVQTIIAFVFVVSYQTWIHTEKIGKLGWLDRVFNTPSVHRVHHGSNSQYLDKNYGGILIIWDRIFGTYQAEDERVIYGITKPLGSANPFVINFSEYGRIFHDVLRASTLRQKLGFIFGKPGWEPHDQSISSGPVNSTFIEESKPIIDKRQNDEL